MWYYYWVELPVEGAIENGWHSLSRVRTAGPHGCLSADFQSMSKAGAKLVRDLRFIET
jgi:hypothetical protein